MPHGITQCYLPPGKGDIPALTPAEAGTRLSDPGGMQGWVECVTCHPAEVTFPPLSQPKLVLECGTETRIPPRERAVWGSMYRHSDTHLGNARVRWRIQRRIKGMHPTPPAYRTFFAREKRRVTSLLNLGLLTGCMGGRCVIGRLLQREAIFDSKCTKSVWRPGSTRARRASLQCFPRLPSWI